MSYGNRGEKVVRKTRKKTATKLYKSAYTNASVTSFGTCSSPGDIHRNPDRDRTVPKEGKGIGTEVMSGHGIPNNVVPL